MYAVCLGLLLYVWRGTRWAMDGLCRAVMPKLLSRRSVFVGTSGDVEAYMRYSRTEEVRCLQYCLR